MWVLRNALQRIRGTGADRRILGYGAVAGLALAQVGYSCRSGRHRTQESTYEFEAHVVIRIIRSTDRPTGRVPFSL